MFLQYLTFSMCNFFYCFFFSFSFLLSFRFNIYTRKVHRRWSWLMPSIMSPRIDIINNQNPGWGEFKKKKSKKTCYWWLHIQLKSCCVNEERYSGHETVVHTKSDVHVFYGKQQQIDMPLSCAERGLLVKAYGTASYLAS